MKFTTIDGALLTLTCGPVMVQGTKQELAEALNDKSPSQFNISRLIQRCDVLTEETSRLNKIVAQTLERDREDKNEDAPQAEPQPDERTPDWAKTLGADHEHLAQFLKSYNWCSSDGERVVDVAIRAIETLQSRVDALMQDYSSWKREAEGLRETNSKLRSEIRESNERNELLEGQLGAPESSSPQIKAQKPETPNVARRGRPAIKTDETNGFDPMWQNPDGSLKELSQTEARNLSPQQKQLRQRQYKREWMGRSKAKPQAPASNEHLDHHLGGRTPQVTPQADGAPSVVEDQFTIEARLKREQVRNGLSESPAGAFGG